MTHNSTAPGPPAAQSASGTLSRLLRALLRGLGGLLLSIAFYVAYIYTCKEYQLFGYSRDSPGQPSGPDFDLALENCQTEYLIGFLFLSGNLRNLGPGQPAHVEVQLEVHGKNGLLARDTTGLVKESSLVDGDKGRLEINDQGAFNSRVPFERCVPIQFLKVRFKSPTEGTGWSSWHECRIKSYGSEDCR